MKPDVALWSKNLGEFLLPYEAIRDEHDHDAVLKDFLQSTYEAEAKLGAFMGSRSDVVFWPKADKIKKT